MSAGSLRRKAWDDALLVLLVDRPGLGGEALLVAIIQEANDALTRLREHGMIEAER